MALIMVLAIVTAIVRGMMEHWLARYLRQKTAGEGYLLMVRLTSQFVVAPRIVLSPDTNSFTS